MRANSSRARTDNVLLCTEMSTLLIATDEAGYGPKLGPLVIAAYFRSGTAQAVRLNRDRRCDLPEGSRPAANKPPSDGPNVDGIGPTIESSSAISFDALNELFSPLRVPFSCDGNQVVVDDSKAVFKPAQGLSSLHTVVSAAMHWAGHSDPRLGDWLAKIADLDVQSIIETPWFDTLDDRSFLVADQTRSLLQHWQRTGLRLHDIRSRIVTARQFNSRCVDGYNKADLLSESTIGLVRSLIDSHESKRSVVSVHCDRHGGRRYYGGLLQHLFPESQLQVIAESKQQSRYRLTRPEQSIEIAFTVKGDSFTPVALSSMVAKYLRERLMDSLNRYFLDRHQGTVPLKPTAGYPVDADRFLRDIGPIIEAEKVTAEDLIRSR